MSTYRLKNAGGLKRTLKQKEMIEIGDDIRIIVRDLSPAQVELLIQAPRELEIRSGESSDNVLIDFGNLLHKQSMRNKLLLQEFQNCSCFHCLSLFLFEDINEWVDEGQTAICPKCPVDAVIPEQPLNILEALKEVYF